MFIESHGEIRQRVPEKKLHILPVGSNLHLLISEGVQDRSGGVTEVLGRAIWIMTWGHLSQVPIDQAAMKNGTN